MRLFIRNILFLKKKNYFFIKPKKAMNSLLINHGAENVSYFMGELSNLATSKLNDKLNELNISKLTATEYLDDGSKLRVLITRSKMNLILDYFLLL